ncbi:MAG: peptidoglycan D,D-transpeptidase FtsI family protein [Acidimicrobiales bacterium]
MMLVVATAMIVLLALRVLDVQGLQASRFASYGQSEQFQHIALPALRGTIYDRTGDVLAVSVPRVDVIADDLLIHSRATVRAAATKLAPILGLGSRRLVANLSEHNGYVPLALDVTTATQNKVAALGLPFVSFVPNQVRKDPTGSLFAPLLGEVGYAGTGLSGIEYLDQRQLAGRQGSEDVAIGPSGTQLPGGAQGLRAAVQGTGLVLSLDQPLQYEVTKALSAQLLAQRAQSGICVVLDTKTGGILSMVNLVREANKVVPAQQNLATNTVYEPGSVMKLATISGALQEHLITPGEQFSVPYTIWLGGWPFQDAEYHPTELLPVTQILAQSSNVGTIEIAHLLGARRLAYFLQDLGFGQKTALDWPGESPGLVPSLPTWSGSDMGTIPIGTGEAVTALQIVDAYNAVANGGEYVPPKLIQATVGPNGLEHVLSGGRAHRVLDRSTVQELLPMLEDVTANGTGTLAQIPGYTVAGKTGTAQIPSTTGPGYQPGAWNATFVGFVPAQNPQLTAIVVLHHPSTMYGGSASAPVFSTIMKYALRHFDISPSGASGLSQAMSNPTKP